MKETPSSPSPLESQLLDKEEMPAKIELMAQQCKIKTSAAKLADVLDESRKEWKIDK